MHSSKQVLQSCSSRCLLAKMLGDSILDIESSPEHFDHMSKISHERKIQDEAEALNLLGLKTGDYLARARASSPDSQGDTSGAESGTSLASSDSFIGDFNGHNHNLSIDDSSLTTVATSLCTSGIVVAQPV